jgi:hypothetical protein
VSTPNDDEMALFSQLEGVFSEVDDDEVINFQELDTRTLIRLYKQTKDRLFEIGQAINEPRTQEARDLHSKYYACKLELQRRGL